MAQEIIIFKTHIAKTEICEIIEVDNSRFLLTSTTELSLNFFALAQRNHLQASRAEAFWRCVSFVARVFLVLEEH